MFLSLNFSIHVVERFPLGNHLQLPEGAVFFLMSVLGTCLEFLDCAVLLSKLQIFLIFF